MADHPRWARFENILAKRPPERFRSLDNKSICAAIQKHFRDRPVATSLPLPPGLGKLPGFMHRFRLKLAAKPRDSPVAGHHEPHHFEHCRDFCNASLLLDHGPLLPDNPKITCSDTMLRVIDMRLSPERVCVPLICPALLDQVFSLLPRPWNLKVSTDGTYRLLFDSYTLITLGINVKNWSPRKDLRIFSFRSSFLPLGFALADTEHDQAYTHLSQTVLQVARTLGHEVTSEHILQWRGDMHNAALSLKRSAFGRLGPCNRCNLTGPSWISWASLERIAYFGPRLLGTLASPALSHHQTVDFVSFPRDLVLCFSSFRRPRAPMFGAEAPAPIFFSVTCGRRFCVGSSMEVCTRSNYAWYRRWFCAPRGLAWHNVKTCLWPRPPTTNCGRRAATQEHRCAAAPTFDCSSCGAQSLQDWPSIGQFLDQHTLAGDTPLRKEGRTCAKGLLAWGLHSRFEDGAGNVWMLVPTSKYKRDFLQPQNRKGTKRYKDRIPLPLPPNALRHFSCIVTANDTRTVESGLERLGLYDCKNHQITNWKHLAKLLDD